MTRERAIRNGVSSLVCFVTKFYFDIFRDAKQGVDIVTKFDFVQFGDGLLLCSDEKYAEAPASRGGFRVITC